MCDFCEGKMKEWAFNNRNDERKTYMTIHRNEPTLVVGMVRRINVTGFRAECTNRAVFDIDYCPKCGRKLDTNDSENEETEKEEEKT